jgi:hypothetical protein
MGWPRRLPLHNLKEPEPLVCDGVWSAIHVHGSPPFGIQPDQDSDRAHLQQTRRQQSSDYGGVTPNDEGHAARGRGGERFVGFLLRTGPIHVNPSTSAVDAQVSVLPGRKPLTPVTLAITPLCLTVFLAVVLAEKGQREGAMRPARREGEESK